MYKTIIDFTYTNIYKKSLKKIYKCIKLKCLKNIQMYIKKD